MGRSLSTKAKHNRALPPIKVDLLFEKSLLYVRGEMSGDGTSILQFGSLYPQDL